MIASELDLTAFIRDVPDFPRAGILFKDITPLLASPEAFAVATDRLAAPFAGARISKVVAIESRGFIFGGPVAQRLGAGLIPVRKPGKLPWTTRRCEYELEYGTDALEMHDDALVAGERILVIDDVLATGGTAAAVVNLVSGCGAEVVAAAFVIELTFLSGRKRLDDVRIESLVRY